jgi:hypothetical protein
VFKLEQTQQSLITQLEHANALATEFHETSVMYHRKYEEALRQIEEMRREHGHEKAIFNYNLEAANEETERERERNQHRSEQIATLEQQLANQCDMTLVEQSQATTIAEITHVDSHEELSPVSVSIPSPRTPMARRGQTPTLDPETPGTPPPTINSFRFQYQCSPAMATCDGLYAQ